jgi:hypothetical protein
MKKSILLFSIYEVKDNLRYHVADLQATKSTQNDYSSKT